MNEVMGLKAKLGLDVFKPDKEPHIMIKPGMEKDPRLKKAMLVCPAGLYSENEKGEVELTIDGCLECGTCRMVCGAEVLDWEYPSGGAGVQFRFG
ncbi:MAG: 4Fe-4S dicluster domain-containing protein [Syntrophomonadaceae bacterium]|nr:4Fe-4S dicluster domain-containing protein [Syntrophomonadaceae bacterium]MDD3889076.1 4Fe-4S dicluster domain-containing protein [Syntrophomonadaceae bacterium]MDD4549092.1 4Fe-4S dicluster domain-containing protein [Syntrophomonadaceae bacterium]